MHVELKFWGVSILASDNMDSTESSKTDSSCGSFEFRFRGSSQNGANLQNLKQDGQATMPLREQFRGDKFGMLTYKFGIKWMFNCQK